jgi:hypothetical protein
MSRRLEGVARHALPYRLNNHDMDMAWVGHAALALPASPCACVALNSNSCTPID